jgi:two-component sensor histidine kinase/exonuclease VII small subunit
MNKCILILSVLFFRVFTATSVVVPDSSRAVLENLISKSINDTTRLKLIYQLSNQNIFKPTSPLSDNKQLLPWLKEGIELSHKLNSLSWEIKFQKLTGDYYFLKMDYESGDYYYKKAIDCCKRNKDLIQEAKLWIKLAYKIRDIDEKNVEKGLSYLNNAVKLFKLAGNKPLEIDASTAICSVWIAQGKLALAQEQLLKLIAQTKSTYYKQRSDIYEALATISGMQGNSISELNYRIEAVKNIERVDMPLETSTEYYWLAITYINQGKYKESMTWAEKCLNILITKRFDPDTHRLTADIIIADLLALKEPEKALLFLKKSIKDIPPQSYNHQLSIEEDFGNIYTALGQYHNAELSYQKMIQTMHHITDDNVKSDTYANVTYYVHYYKAIIKFYIITGQYIKARRFLSYVFKLPQNQIAPVKKAQYYMMQFKVDSALGNFHAAINDYEAQKTINDSLFNAAKTKQLDELTLKYQTFQKEQSISLLKSKNKNQEILMQKAKLKLKVTLGGIIMLFALTGLAYRGYQVKKRGIKNLQLKQLEINQQNEKLAHLIELKDELIYDKDKLLLEKDWLMKEVHHRVKNNLQIVMSLLSTQSAFLGNNVALEAITDSQNRVQAIALIHQKLYSGNQMASIRMAEYIIDLVNNLSDCFDLKRRGIVFQKRVENISLDFSQAVPVGLFLNEAITNAIKYAFDTDGGEIAISLQHTKTNTLLLNIKDNGKGMPQNFSIKTASSLGIELMKALSKQIDGQFTIKSNKGVTVSMEFQFYKLLT